MQICSIKETSDDGNSSESSENSKIACDLRELWIDPLKYELEVVQG
jgi:hypothetical protein